MGLALLDNSTLPEDILQSQTTTTFKKSEKHKVVMLIQEQQKSPMESPLTESGQWTDTGISTGELSGKVAKPTTLEGLDSSINIDTEGDLSEISPMKDEEIVDSHSTEVEDTIMTYVSLPSTIESKPIDLQDQKTQEVSTSPMSVDGGQDKALSPMSQPEVFDASTQESKEVQDVKLSPILFLQSIGTSPILIEAKDIIETASSPPKTLSINTATSPTKEDDKASPKSPEVPSESLEFEISMTDDEVSKTSEALIDVQKVEVQETKIETEVEVETLDTKEPEIEVVEQPKLIEEIEVKVEQTTLEESVTEIDKTESTQVTEPEVQLEQESPKEVKELEQIETIEHAEHIEHEEMMVHEKTEITEVQNIEKEMEVKEEVMTIESPEIKEHETIEIPFVKDVEGAIKTTGDKSVMKQDDDKGNEIDHAVTIEEIDDDRKESVKKSPLRN